MDGKPYASVCVESTPAVLPLPTLPSTMVRSFCATVTPVLTANIRTLPLPLAQIEATAAQARRAAIRKSYITSSATRVP